MIRSIGHVFCDTRSRTQATIGLALLAGFLSTSLAANPPRFELSGSGSLDGTSETSHGHAMEIAAVLTLADPAQRTTRAGARFDMSAALSSRSIVCYDDTIFRDDFDGDGF